MPIISWVPQDVREGMRNLGVRDSILTGISFRGEEPPLLPENINL